MVTLCIRALLYKEQDILLLRRANTGFSDGLYNLPGGFTKPEEPPLDAIVRKVYEETRLTIPKSAFNFVHTFYRKSDRDIIVLCFKADITGTQPYNNQPEKHDAIDFFNIYRLPENIIYTHKHVIESAEKHSLSYSEHI